MKKAALKDCWDALTKVSSAAGGIVRITQNDQILGPRHVRPEGIFAIVGANGAGKTSFFNFLTNTQYGRVAFKTHQIELADGSVLNIPGDVTNATVIDPYSQLKRSNELLNNVRSTFDQEELSSVPATELGLINYVLGSKYQEIKIEEVEVGGDEVCPRFVLINNQGTFDNDTLSLGEQLVVYLYWLLVKKHKTPGIYFIEEPESGLSPSGQSRITDLMAYISSKKAKQLFISTHSPFIVAALGKERVIVMKKSVNSEWVLATQHNYLDELGIDIGKKGIFFLEDNKAKVFFEKILDLYGSTLRKSFDMIFLGGESNVFEVVNRIGSLARTIKIYGVMDADQKTIDKYNNSPGDFYFLPGTLPPEKEIFSAIEQNIPGYARAIGVRVQALTDAIRKCQGYETHDFFEELSKSLFGEVKSSVYEVAFGIWYASYNDKEEIHQLIRNIDPDITEEDIRDAEALYK